MPPIDRPLFVAAPAKLNLTLDVLGRRPDGYHELASVMQTIALADTLALWPAPDDTLTLVCDAPDLDGEDNLALRAARLIRDATGCRRGVRLALQKRIPAQGGLGGGSSDGATVLVALNRWWGLGLRQADLIDLAARLGSDVPFFVVGGTALVEGRGEIVTPLPDAPPLWLVVVKPAVAVPTPAVFRALDPADWSDGAATRDLVAAIRAGRWPDLTDAALRNALEPGVLRSYPAVAAARAALLAAGAPVVRMSGSGPTLYVPCAHLADAVPLHRAALALGLTVWLTRTVGRAVG